MIKRVDARKGAVSSGGRLILVNSCLSGILSFIMSMFLLNKTTLSNLNKPTRSFFGKMGDLRRKFIGLDGM